MTLGKRSYVIGPTGGLPGSSRGLEVLAGGAQTEGKFALVRYTTRVQIYPHVHEQDDESVFVLSGNPTVTIDGVDNPLSPGSFIFMPRGVPHAISMKEDWVGFSVSSPGGVFDALMEDLAGVYASAETITEQELSANVGEALLRHGIRVLEGKWVGEMPITQ